MTAYQSGRQCIKTGEIYWFSPTYGYEIQAASAALHLADAKERVDESFSQWEPIVREVKT